MNYITEKQGTPFDSIYYTSMMISLGRERFRTRTASCWFELEVEVVIVLTEVEEEVL